MKAIETFSGQYVKDTDKLRCSGIENKYISNLVNLKNRVQQGEMNEDIIDPNRIAFVKHLVSIGRITDYPRNQTEGGK